MEKADRLYVYVTDMWPEDPIWQQMHTAMTNVAKGDDAAAEAAVDKLLNDFAGNQYLPVALHETAKLYSHFKKYQKGLELNQYVIEHWPEHEYAMWSEREVAKANIELGKMQEAQAAVDKVLAGFPSQQFIALVVYEIAEHYRQFEHYDKAERLYKHILESWPTNWRVVLAQSGLARLYIDSGDDAAAQAAVDKLRTDFLHVQNAARGIYLVAYDYDQAGNYEKAKPLYEFVLANWPADWYAMWSRSRLAVSDIALGHIEAAQTSADRLTADFQLEERIAEATYDVAYQFNACAQYGKAKQLYQYVADTWPDTKEATWSKIGLAQANISLGEISTAEQIIDGLVAKLNEDFSGDSELTAMVADGYYYGGDCYLRLDKHAKSIQCFQKVAYSCPDYDYAWNALFMIGRNMEILVKSGKISKSEAFPVINAIYEQLLEKYPDCEAGTYAQNWLSGQDSK